MIDFSKIPKQKLLVENGEVGDCWRCCVAAIVGLNAEDVPHFLLTSDGKTNHNMDPDTQRWLNQRGYGMIYATAIGCSRGAIWCPRYADDEIQPPPLITCGPTCRSEGLGKHHAVITIGGKLVYDPHPSEAGLTAIAEEYLIFKL